MSERSVYYCRELVNYVRKVSILLVNYVRKASILARKVSVLAGKKLIH